jgi:hypothetical protein
MLRTDLLVRGIPWVGLLLEHRNPKVGLNLGWRHRLSALASVGAIAAAGLQSMIAAGIAFAALFALNFNFYALLARRGGVRHALSGIVLHLLHHLVAIVALVVGVFLYVAARRRTSRAAEAPASLAAEA